MKEKLVNKTHIKISNKFILEQVCLYLGQGKRVALQVKGNSMKPFLLEDEQVFLEPFEFKKLGKGKIVLAKSGDQMILHRVVKYNRETVWLAGDGNLVQTERIKMPEVLGIAVGKARDEAEINLTSWWRCFIGYIWFVIRPLRRIASKLI